MTAALPHGGDLAAAQLQWGQAREAWLDLSTGVAPWSYPAPAIEAAAWHRLPSDVSALMQAAERYYGSSRLLPVAGAIAAIRALPRVCQRWHRRARVIVAPLSFNEHAAAWSRAGHSVRAVPVAAFDAAVDEADVAIVCQPNNPTCEDLAPTQLLAWRERLAARGGWLVVDEAFRDGTPERSVIAAAGEPGLIVLRSLGKFFGLAGARVGFVAARPLLLDLLHEELGPWCLSGPAQVVAAAALLDGPWQAAQQQRLRSGAARLAALCHGLGLPVAHTDYFAWTEAPRAQALHEALARQAIWSRRFEVAGQVSLRLGLPAGEDQWQRLQQALHTSLHG